MPNGMWVRAVGIGALLTGLAACGSATAAPAAAPTIPAGADAQVTLQVEIAQQLSHQGLTVSDIACPSTVAPVVATTATCTGVIAGQTLNLSVTFVDNNQITVTVVA